MRALCRAIPRQFLTAVLPLLLPAAALAAPATATADENPVVRLPVMASRLAEDASCADASRSVAKMLPWEQQGLDLARTSRFSDGSGVKVAVVDTGVSTEAPALAGRVEAVGSAGRDCVGHGSFVAGLIAAAPVKGVRFIGVAPRAEIIGIRGTDERGTPSPGLVAGGIRAAVDAGADIVDVSVALDGRTRELDEAVSYAAEHDVLIVAAAVPDPPGRGLGSSPAPPRDHWPAAAPGVLSVLDVDVRGQRPKTAPLPAHAPDLTAPGDGVVGIGPKGDGHFIGSGASLAAAYTAGAAALVRSAFPDLSAAEVARRLTATAYPADVPRLDPYAAVTAVRDEAAPGRAGVGADGAPVRLPDTSASERATRKALLIAGAGGAVVLGVGWAAVVVPRGRARRWRPSGT